MCPHASSCTAKHCSAKYPADSIILLYFLLYLNSGFCVPAPFRKYLSVTRSPIGILFVFYYANATVLSKRCYTLSHKRQILTYRKIINNFCQVYITNQVYNLKQSKNSNYAKQINLYCQHSR